MDSSIPAADGQTGVEVARRNVPPARNLPADLVIQRLRDLGLWGVLSDLASGIELAADPSQLAVDSATAEQLRIELYRLSQAAPVVARLTSGEHKMESQSQAASSPENPLGQFDEARLKEEILRLGPWHMNVQLTETLSTGQAFDTSGAIRNRDQNRGISLLSLRDHFVKKLNQLYPQGVSAKSFLDCACNAGGYCFWARELEIRQALGFDVREHWIRQAKFIQAQRRVAATDRIEFQVCDLYDLPKLNRPPVEITMFKGIFYHLPDPITGLKVAADMTREVMFFNTSTTWGEADGYLKCGWESRERLMSGVHGLKWYATGPKVLADILKWAGFVEQRLMFYVQQHDQPQLGRVEIIASKVPGLLERIGGEPIG